MIYRFRHPETGAITYPFVKAQLPAVFPSTSFPFPISDECAAEHGCLPVATIERPEHDPRTQRLEEHDPEELPDGTLRQVLTVRPATEEEVAAWDAANQPAPDWSSFKSAMLSSTTVNAALVAAMPAAPSAVMALPAALMALAIGGDSGDFRACWLMLRRLELVPQGVLDEVTAAATACHLPQGVISSLGGAD
jgi:hypothetical protein